MDIEILSTSKTPATDVIKHWSERSKILEDVYNKKTASMVKVELKELENQEKKGKSVVDVLYQETAYKSAVRKLKAVDDMDNGKKSARER